MICSKKRIVPFMIAAIFGLSGVFTACQRMTKPAPQQEEESGQLASPPSSLEDLQKGSEEIIKSLEALDEDKLKEVDKNISTLQGKWNSFWPKAQSAGADEELKRQFESALDHLTNIISNGNDITEIDKDQAMHASVLLTKTLPDFMDLFKTEIPTDIYRLRFLSQDLHAYTVENNWQMAKENMKQILLIWQGFQPTLSKKDKDLALEMDYAIEQLTNVVSQNNPNLTEVKVKDVMLKIVDKAEKKYEE